MAVFLLAHRLSRGWWDITPQLLPLSLAYWSHGTIRHRPRVTCQFIGPIAYYETAYICVTLSQITNPVYIGLTSTVDHSSLVSSICPATSYYVMPHQSCLHDSIFYWPHINMRHFVPVPMSFCLTIHLHSHNLVGTSVVRELITQC